MKKTTSIIALITLASATAAHAQTSEPTKVFINVSAAVQAVTHKIDTSFSFPLYGQTAKVATHLESESGPLFDLNAGYRLWPQIGVAVGFTNFSKTTPIGATATIPSPVVSNNAATVDVSVASAKRTERSVYLLAVWFYPVTEQIELAFSAGPSSIRVEQDLISSVTVPSGTQTGASVVTKESARGWGVNTGIDASYLFKKNYGAGIFVRYNGASTDLASASDVKAGGFQAGIGARIRF